MNHGKIIVNNLIQFNLLILEIMTYIIMQDYET